MLLIYTATIAGLLVTGQAFWKSAAKIINGEPFSVLNLINKVLLSPRFIIGASIYVVATLGYIWLFSKFPYYAVQMSLIAFSLIFSLLLSVFLFKEHLSFTNYLGVTILIMGVFLVTWKS